MQSSSADIAGADPRRVQLEGSHNFRDIGGYTGDGGRTVRSGCIFRADHLGNLTDADLDVLAGLGIRTVCDLRKVNEREAMPDRFHDAHGVDVVHLPVGGEAAQRYAIMARILAGEITSFTVDEVIDVYVRILHDFPRSMAAVLEAAADPARVPLVVHCTAGKDRTGLAVALLLDALGVNDDQIGDDHELTDRYSVDTRLKALRPQLDAAGVQFDDVASFLLSPREVILGTLAVVRGRWGSVEHYLVGAAGASEHLVNSLRANLLVSA